MRISKKDKKHLKVIRNNVKNFVNEVSIKYDKKDTILLDIAPQDYLGAREFFSKSIIKTLDINPDSNADYIADICANNANLIPSNYFHLILLTEVLEHTLNPFKAIKEINRILKKQGFVFISVPFNLRIHGPLPDCWRFTEHGIRELLKDFNIIKLNAIETPNRALMPIHYTIIAQKKK